MTGSSKILRMATIKMEEGRPQAVDIDFTPKDNKSCQNKRGTSREFK